MREVVLLEMRDEIKPRVLMQLLDLVELLAIVESHLNDAETTRVFDEGALLYRIGVEDVHRLRKAALHHLIDLNATGAIETGAQVGQHLQHGCIAVAFDRVEGLDARQLTAPLTKAIHHHREIEHNEGVVVVLCRQNK